MSENEKLFTYRNKCVVAGEIYHITQRAPGQEKLFLEDNDYLTILALLKDCVKEFDLNLLCFCLMPNHLHLLLKIIKPNLSKAMHSLYTSYAMRFNAKYQRKGHAFCGVYRAAMCLDDAHLIGSSIYIHLNPLKAKLTNDIFNYRWSSINVYANPEIGSFVKSGLILKILDDDLKKASFLYKDLLKGCIDTKYENIIENPRAGVNFTKAIFGKLLDTLHGRTFKKDSIDNELSIDRIIEDFKAKKRKNTPEDKKAAAYLVAQLKSRGFSITEMAQILNTTRQSIYNLTNKVQPRM